MNVGAVLWRGESVLLVQQRGPNDAAPGWALPGGRVEMGELLPEALAREVAEETGLRVTQVGPLIYAAQLQCGPHREAGMSFVFQVDAWHGDLGPADPEGKVLDARFVPVDDAVPLLTTGLKRRIMREPIVAFLRGEAPRGAFWYYAARTDGDEDLLGRNG